MNSNYVKHTNLFAGEKLERTNASIFWDIENISIPTGKGVQFIFDRFRALSMRYYLFLTDIIIVGNATNIGEEYRNEFKKRKIQYIDTNRHKKNAADVDLVSKMLEYSVNNRNQHYVFIVLTGDNDFERSLIGLGNNPLHKSILIHLWSSSKSFKARANITINWLDFVTRDKIEGISNNVDTPNNSDSDDDTNLYSAILVELDKTKVLERFIVSRSMNLRTGNIVKVVIYMPRRPTWISQGTIIDNYDLSYPEYNIKMVNITFIANNRTEHMRALLRRSMSQLGWWSR
jgi:hypothetical protein